MKLEEVGCLYDLAETFRRKADSCVETSKNIKINKEPDSQTLTEIASNLAAANAFYEAYLKLVDVLNKIPKDPAYL